MIISYYINKSGQYRQEKLTGEKKMKDIRTYLAEVGYVGSNYDVNNAFTSAYEEVIKLSPEELDVLEADKHLCHLIPLARAYAELTNSRKV